MSIFSRILGLGGSDKKKGTQVVQKVEPEDRTPQRRRRGGSIATTPRGVLTPGAIASPGLRTTFG